MLLYSQGTLPPKTWIFSVRYVDQREVAYPHVSVAGMSNSLLFWLVTIVIIKISNCHHCWTGSFDTFISSIDLKMSKHTCIFSYCPFLQHICLILCFRACLFKNPTFQNMQVILIGRRSQARAGTSHRVYSFCTHSLVRAAAPQRKKTFNVQTKLRFFVFA